MASVLPKFFVLQFSVSSSYLRPVEHPKVASLNELRFDEENILSPRVKFQREESETGDPTLVHIRSCFNNKYWVTHENGEGEIVISASADKREEDTKNPSCTLFRAISKGMYFNFESVIWLTANAKDDWRALATAVYSGPLKVLKEIGNMNFVVHDWENLVRLPSEVTIKYGDKYLRVADHEIERARNFAWFESGLEPTDPRVAFQLIPTRRGGYQIKSLHSGMFLILSGGDEMSADGLSSGSSFEFVIISGNTVAIRAESNFRFLGMQSDSLGSYYRTATGETRWTIEERVMKREITIGEYHLPLSRIFEAEVLALAEVTIQNKSPQSELKQVIKFSETVETTNHWNNSGSVKVGVAVEFHVTVIPDFAGAQVKASVEVGYGHKWGGSGKQASKIESNTTVTVSPSTNMKVSLLCTRATCDVPFSYNQNDLLPDGRWVSKVYDDGIYTGVNTFEFRIRSVEVDNYGGELEFPKVEPALVTITKMNPKK